MYPDFKSEDPATDPAIVEQARRLSAGIEKSRQVTEHSPAPADELEAEFGGRVKHATFLTVHVTTKMGLYSFPVARASCSTFQEWHDLA